MTRILIRSLRSLGILATGVLFLSAGGALGFDAHDCPHHDAVPGAHVAPPDRAPGEGGHAHAGEGHAGPHSPGHPDPCRCVGTCHGSSVVPIVHGTLASALPAGSTRRVRDQAPPVSIAQRSIPYLIPFPNPPPFPV